MKKYAVTTYGQNELYPQSNTKSLTPVVETRVSYYTIKLLSVTYGK